MPYGGGDGIDISIPAAADFSAKQFRFVKVDVNGRGTICSATTDVVLGILQNKPDAADVPARVRVDGVSKIAIDGAANEGALIASDTIGMGTVVTGAGAFVGAILLHATGGSADVQDALIVHLYPSAVP